MIRFIGNKPDGLPQKRSQSLRACEQCRKRKKRCCHGQSVPDISIVGSLSSSPLESLHPSTTGSGLFTTSMPHLRAVTSSGDATIPPLASTNQVDDNDQDESDGGNGDRFVGDLNPESTFLAATNSSTAPSPEESNVGVWLPRRVLEGFRKRTDSGNSVQSPSGSSQRSSTSFPFVQLQPQQLLPQTTDYEELYRIYLQEIHPIFPVVDLELLRMRSVISSPDILLIKQAICLAACTSPRAARHLQLHRSSSGIYQATGNAAGEFASLQIAAICNAIDTGFVKNRVVIVQVMTVAAFFSQFSAQSGKSAELTARVISHAQTVGLHLEFPDNRNNALYLARLFCCVWGIDKLNAAFQGRPTMIHDHDFGRDLSKAIESQDGGFRLFLRVVSYLDAVIALYRPRADAANNSSLIKTLPPFEELMHECDAMRVPSNILATIELLYHAVIMLSCRSKSAVQTATFVDIRETVSARSVVTIIGTEFRDQISHLPFAPYALSLSLRVLYRELRFSSKSPFTRTRARQQLVDACKLLRSAFTGKFPSVLKVAELAEKTVHEMDKVYNSILRQHNSSRLSPDTGGNSDVSTVVTENAVSSTAENNHANTDPSSTIPSDPFPFQAWVDADVFEHFDSEFDLDAIDTALVNNTTLAFPYCIDDYGIESFTV